jgi:hypothetical protein
VPISVLLLFFPNNPLDLAHRRRCSLNINGKYRQESAEFVEITFPLPYKSTCSVHRKGENSSTFTVVLIPGSSASCYALGGGGGGGGYELLDIGNNKLCPFIIVPSFTYDLVPSFSFLSCLAYLFSLHVSARLILTTESFTFIKNLQLKDILVGWVLV